MHDKVFCKSNHLILILVISILILIKVIICCEISVKVLTCMEAASSIQIKSVIGMMRMSHWLRLLNMMTHLIDENLIIAIDTVMHNVAGIIVITIGNAYRVVVIIVKALRLILIPKIIVVQRPRLNIASIIKDFGGHSAN